jgi:hypothetical protein
VKLENFEKLVPASGIEPLEQFISGFSLFPVGSVSLPFIAHRIANKT